MQAMPLQRAAGPQDVKRDVAAALREHARSSTPDRRRTPARLASPSGNERTRVQFELQPVLQAVEEARLRKGRLLPPVALVEASCWARCCRAAGNPFQTRLGRVHVPCAGVSASRGSRDDGAAADRGVRAARPGRAGRRLVPQRRGRSVLPGARSWRPRSSCPGGHRLASQRPGMPFVASLGRSARPAARADRRPLPVLARPRTPRLAGLRLALRRSRSRSLVLLPFLSAMLALFFTDWDHKLLPDRITPRCSCWPGLRALNARLTRAARGRAGTAARAWPPLPAAAGFGALFLVGWLCRSCSGREAPGGGDPKLMAAVGAYPGQAGAVVTIFGGSCWLGRWSCCRSQCWAGAGR